MLQLTLPVTPRGAPTFATFNVAANGAAVATLRDPAESMVYLWGAAGSGKSHLLNALCNAAASAGESALIIDLAAPGDLHPDVLVGLEGLDWVCLDNLQAIAGQADWERGLFDLCNRVRDSHGRLRVCAQGAPNTLALDLPDLLSRLEWGPVFKLEGLDDAGKADALELHAESRKLPLPADVKRFLLHHAPRDTAALFDMLTQLDQNSLSHQRPLTVPFVKQMLGL